MALRSSGARSSSGEVAGVACLFGLFVVAVGLAFFLVGWVRERLAPFVRAMFGLMVGCVEQCGEWSCQSRAHARITLVVYGVNAARGQGIM
jgi:hypothetical protein